MNIIESLLSGGVQGLFSGIGQFAKDIRQALTGEISPEKKAEIEQRALEIEYALTKAQTDINLAEAQHPSRFIAGWRPAIGWVCASGLFVNFVFNPLFQWATRLAGKDLASPAMDISTLMTMVLSLLGLGTMRSVEKIKAAEGNR